MLIDFEDFKLKMLEMIAIANQNIKREKEYLEQLEDQCNEGYWRAFDPENPYQIIPDVKITIKCLEEQIRMYETSIDIAKSLLI